MPPREHARHAPTSGLESWTRQAARPSKETSVFASGIDWSASSYEELCRRHRWHVPDRMNIGTAVCDAFADGSGRVALLEVDGRAADPDIWQIRRVSFDELKRLSDRFALGLAELGVAAGDRVAVFLPQRLEAAVAHLAALKLGAICVPLSPLFRADALSHRLRASGAKVLVTDADHHVHVSPLRAALPELSTVIACEERLSGTEAFARVLAASSAEFHAVDSAADDPAMLVFTSGTSGLPKGALHAHRFLPGRLSGFELIHELENGPHPQRPFWTPADWAWVGGLVDCVLTPWAFGRPVVAFRRSTFEPAQLFELVMRMRVRSMFLPPTAINRLRRVEGAEDLGLDVFSVHTAGERLLPETLAWAERTFGKVYELYGLTEMGAVIGSSRYVPVRPGAIGKPFPGHPVVLLDDNGLIVDGPGEGEIAVRRGDPGMFLGYWNDPAATAERFRGDFLVTGDVASRDEDGYYWYQGRNDDLFNTSGYRVGPTEIEEALERHPAVLEAAVVGEPDSERGEIVKAFVVLERDQLPSAELAAGIQTFVKQHLAAYEYPRRIVFARELPRTTTGKLQRAALRDADAERRYGL
jgi:acetyl-CoA synthetase